ncbi:phenylacetic acid degradation b [Fulvivirga sediminis]|uniref:Phenylacetic acid degradation b n=1 Tax=Fulvivirga sediminis TaxID=2803949 RepID=A0A937JZW2_9BACT|nr:phenylacetic acid degradation b [Fulvivirga sediminis]MBL3655646.1 phenylacetic acid degradation b [Fulvivirga sediminis]
MNKSLDPRINRLNIDKYPADLTRKVPLDQFGTYEVFTQSKTEQPYQHEGIVHAPSKEMAFIFAKEQFSRRMTCSGLFVVETKNIFVTATTENNINVYHTVSEKFDTTGHLEQYEFFHLLKRGKQHLHVGSIEARNAQEALALAKPAFSEEDPVLNAWIIKTKDILFSSEEDTIIWNTLPDKKFRNASAYKASDKIKAFKESQKSTL